MPDNYSVKSNLLKLAMMRNDLCNNKWKTEDSEKLETIIHLEKWILRQFGLPDGPSNCRLLKFRKVPTGAEVVEKIKSLSAIATNFLLSDARSGSRVLNDSLESMQDPLDILGELDIPAHVYTLYVYNKIFLKGKDRVENVLAELRLVSDPVILDALGQIANEDPAETYELTEKLKVAGVRYIDRFLIYSSDLLDDDDY